jgi:hypothetical protein
MAPGHVEHDGAVVETEPGLAAGLRIGFRVDGPPALEAVFAGQGRVDLVGGVAWTVI